MNETDQPASPSRRGEVIRDRYVLGDVIGTGGMGIVYAAVQTSLHRTVAIKLPKAELVGDPEVLAQFRTEAMTGAHIHHRNVVGVVDFGRHAGAPFLVMEHVVGPRLGEVVTDRGPLPLSLAANLVHQVLAGLADVHAGGVVHGDVKADNILVEALRDGSSVPRLMDFGLARFADQTWIARGDRVVAGTPDYLAPELVLGGPTSFASDVYAMGMVCYEMITGETPFAGGTSKEIMQRQLSDIVLPMSWRRPRVPLSFDGFVARAVAKEPAERFANGREMCDALAEVAIDLAAMTSLHEDASPILISTDHITAPMHLPASFALAVGTNEPPTRVEQRRREVENAMLVDDPDALVISYLELAHALVEAHDLATAISELERGVAILDRSLRPGPVWRVLLTLAALYDGIGDRARACSTTRAAQQQARRERSLVGQRRAKALYERLVRPSRPAARPAH